MKSNQISWRKNWNFKAMISISIGFNCCLFCFPKKKIRKISKMWILLEQMRALHKFQRTTKKRKHKNGYCFHFFQKIQNILYNNIWCLMYDININLTLDLLVYSTNLYGIECECIESTCNQVKWHFVCLAYSNCLIKWHFYVLLLSTWISDFLRKRK